MSLQIDNETKIKFNELCRKSKKVCSVCECKLGPPTKEQLANFKGRAWCSWVSFRHPIYKSKSYRLCGECYGEILRRDK